MGIRPAFIRKVKPDPVSAYPTEAFCSTHHIRVYDIPKWTQEGMEYARCASPNAVIQTWKTSPIMFQRSFLTGHYWMAPHTMRSTFLYTEQTIARVRVPCASPLPVFEPQPTVGERLCRHDDDIESQKLSGYPQNCVYCRRFVIHLWRPLDSAGFTCCWKDGHITSRSSTGSGATLSFGRCRGLCSVFVSRDEPRDQRYSMTSCTTRLRSARRWHRCR